MVAQHSLSKQCLPCMQVCYQHAAHKQSPGVGDTNLVNPQQADNHIWEWQFPCNLTNNSRCHWHHDHHHAHNTTAINLQSMLPLSPSTSLHLLCRLATLLQLQPHIRRSTFRGLRGAKHSNKNNKGQVLRLLCCVSCSYQPHHKL